MYKNLVFAVTIVLLCDIRVIISQPLDKEQQKLFLLKQDGSLSVEGLTLSPNPSSAHEKDDPSQRNIKKIIIQPPVVVKETLTDLLPERYDQDVDTKKHYYLFKVKEYYDFLPLYSRQDRDRNLRLEIADRGDLGYPDTDADNEGSNDESLVKRDVSHFNIDTDENDSEKVLKKRETNVKPVPDVEVHVEKREISDATLKDFLNVFQTNFIRRKREVHELFNHQCDQHKEHHLVKRDLGNFLPERMMSADPDDPGNNNYRYVSYVPFYRFRKYYISKKRLDIDER